MRDERINRLSEAQKQCLRLVQQGFEAKEIARLLQISPGAVVERLRAARRTLDVSTSREAARSLAAFEAYNPDVDKPIGIAEAPESRTLEPSIGSGSAGGRRGTILFEEEQKPYRFEPRGPQRSFPWPFPVTGRRHNDLTVLQTLMTVLALTIALGMAALVAVALVDQLSRLRFD